MEKARNILVGALAIWMVILGLRWIGAGLEFFMGRPVYYCSGVTCGQHSLTVNGLMVCGWATLILGFTLLVGRIVTTRYTGTDTRTKGRE